MTDLRTPFQGRQAFAASARYRLMPFRFHPLASRYLLMNEVGEYALLPRDELEQFVEHQLEPGSSTYQTLKSKHFLFDETSRAALDLMALKYRTRASRVAEFTALHMFVVTLRCDHSCHYCQVSRQAEGSGGFDMSREHADASLGFVFRSPAKHIKIEFQGGEPLLHFELVRYIVEKANLLNQSAGRRLSFVIASSLSRLSEEILTFCKEHSVHLSTSLDGPRDLHESQRPLRDRSSYDAVVAGIGRARKALGASAVSALMTTTPSSLTRVEDIVDEYVVQGFDSIFLRSLSPYGFAARSLIRRYGVTDWIEFYKRGMRHILALNERGVRLREELAATLLQNLFSPNRSGYVDLQSPAGIGIGGIVYNYDGAVFASDEGRMLAEMGDQSLRLGHIAHDSYEDIMTGAALLGPLEESVLESNPMCADCAFAPACGADPAYHRATQQDWVGHKAFSDFCKKQMAVLEFLVELLDESETTRRLLLRWV